MRIPLNVAVCSTLLAFPLMAPAAGDPRPVVGTILSNGNFEVAHTPASGTATVLNGDEVSTSGTSSRIMLKGGTELELQPNSSGAIFSNHATLDAGTVKTKLANDFYLTSRAFTVRSTESNTQAILQASAKALTVSVPSGGADVMNVAGSKLVHMAPGTTLNFGAYDTAASSAANVNAAWMLGVLDRENGHYIVRDRFTNTVSELVGTEVNPKLLNHLVVVDGNTTGTGASSLAQVDRVVQVSRLAPSDATTMIPCTPDGNGGIARIIHLDGMVSKVREHFLLKEKSATYELVGEVNDKDIGTDLKARGFVLPRKQAILPAEKVVYTERRNYVLAASPCAGALLGGALVTTGTITAATITSSAAVIGKAQVTPISY